MSGPIDRLQPLLRAPYRSSRAIVGVARTDYLICVAGSEAAMRSKSANPITTATLSWTKAVTCSCCGTRTQGFGPRGPDPAFDGIFFGPSGLDLRVLISNADGCSSLLP